eukprot:226898-Chlamydomonas_euryale.AAC.2
MHATNVRNTLVWAGGSKSAKQGERGGIATPTLDATGRCLSSTNVHHKVTNVHHTLCGNTHMPHKVCVCHSANVPHRRTHAQTCRYTVPLPRQWRPRCRMPLRAASAFHTLGGRHLGPAPSQVPHAPRRCVRVPRAAQWPARPLLQILSPKRHSLQRNAPPVFPFPPRARTRPPPHGCAPPHKHASASRCSAMLPPFPRALAHALPLTAARPHTNTPAPLAAAQPAAAEALAVTARPGDPAVRACHAEG